MVGVVAAVGGEVEGDGEPGLARGEVLAVEGVGLLGGGVTRVLAQGPGATGVHRRPGTADEGREARQRIEMFQPFEIRGGVEGLDINAFGVRHFRSSGAWPRRLLLDEGRPCVQVRFEISGHGSPRRYSREHQGCARSGTGGFAWSSTWAISEGMPALQVTGGN